MADTFSVVYYEDGAIEIIAGDIHETIDQGQKWISNRSVLEYMMANKVAVRYVESGIKHLRIDATPRLDILEWNRIELSEDAFINNYIEEE